MSNVLYPVTGLAIAYPQDLNQVTNGLDGNADIGDITAYSQITALPGALTAAAGATGSLSGAYAYKVTFVTGLVDGTGTLHVHGETTGGTTSTTVNVTSQNINLSAIPIGPTGTIARKIYRTVAGGSSFLFDFQISDNTTTSWTDSTVDGGLGVAVPSTNTTGSRFVGSGAGLNNIPVSAMSLSSLVSTLDLVIDVKRDYNASGSAQTTTGSITAGTPNLTLASALDFKNGQGIVIANAGPATALTTPTGLTVTTAGTAGTTSYTYSVAAVDMFGGMTPVASQTLTTGNATLSNTNYNVISWSAVANAFVYAVYRSGGTAGNGLINFVDGGYTTLNDRNFSVITPPFNIPASPPASPVAQFLSTTIVSGAGTTSLTLDINALTGVSNGLIAHDDTVAVQNALDQGGEIFFPAGTYNASNRLINSHGACLMVSKNTELSGVQGLSIIKSLMSYMTVTVLTNYGNIYSTSGDTDITLHDMVFDGGIPDSTIYVSSNGSTYSTGYLVLLSSSATPYPQRIVVENNKFQNTTGYGCVFSNISYGRMVKNYVINTGRDGLDAFGNCSGIVIENNTIRFTGDDGIGISANSASNISSGITISGNYINNAGSRGINVNGVYHSIANNIIINTASYGIEINNNDYGQRTDHLAVTGNIISSAGQYTGGINGWSADTVNGTYGINVDDYAGTTANQVSNIGVSSNVIQGGAAYGVRVAGVNATLAINKVTIANNMLDAGGMISVSGTVAPTNIKVMGNSGYNPVGNFSAPVIPASGTAYANSFFVTCRVFVTGGTVTAIAINGTATGITAGMVELAPGDTITLTYSVAPTWVWFGN